MTIYRFSIEVGGIDPNEEGIEKRFYGNGVDDASVCVLNGVLFLEFDREARSEEDAIFSATRDIIERGGKVNLVTRDKPQTFNLPHRAKRRQGA